MQTTGIKTYRMSHQGRKVNVAPERAHTAARMDKDQNGYISNDEIAFFYGLPEESQIGNNREARLHENKFHLRAIPNPVREDYRSFGQIESELKDLAKKHPDLCQLHVLGHTAEERPIYALKVTTGAQGDTSHKTGVVFKGLEHAREWTTAEVTAHSAAETVKKAASGDEEYLKRLDKAEVWFLPVVNPDGLEHSRDVDNAWRKNRAPVETITNGDTIISTGVDINRNYGDGSTLGNQIYRPTGDKPNTWQDDFEGGADAPWSDVYRGESAGSEKETDAVQGLELGNENIRGVLGYHSFGESIVYPFGHTNKPIADLGLFRDLAEQMNQAAGGQMELKSSAGLYPISGAGIDIEYINGIVGYTMEINDCFQPEAEVLQPTNERFHAVNMTFLDQMIERAEKGQLPERKVPERYQGWNLA